MSEHVIQRGILKVCCANPVNLRAERLSESLLVRVCRECGCRHFEATAEPGRLGVTGSRL